MLALGNDIANGVWEYCLNGKQKPTSESLREEKEQWIRWKYEEKAFLPPSNPNISLGKLLIDSVCRCVKYMPGVSLSIEALFFFRLIVFYMSNKHFYYIFSPIEQWRHASIHALLGAMQLRRYQHIGQCRGSAHSFASRMRDWESCDGSTFDLGKIFDNLKGKSSNLFVMVSLFCKVFSMKKHLLYFWFLHRSSFTNKGNPLTFFTKVEKFKIT